MHPDQAGFTALAALVSVFIGWLIVGGEYNRRRAGRLARWVYQGLRPLLGRASIRWLTAHAFELFVDEPPHPFGALKVTGLLESRDMVAVWLYNRLAGRSDLLVVRANLRRKPIWGFEAFQPRTILSGDARQEAEAEGWAHQPPDRSGLETWHGGGKGEELCRQMVEAAGGLEQDVIRLAVHRREPHLVLAVSAARFDRQDALWLFQTFRRLAEVAEEYASPS